MARKLILRRENESMLTPCDMAVYIDGVQRAVLPLNATVEIEIGPGRQEIYVQNMGRFNRARAEKSHIPAGTGDCEGRLGLMCIVRVKQLPAAQEAGEDAYRALADLAVPAAVRLFDSPAALERMNHDNNRHRHLCVDARYEGVRFSYLLNEPEGFEAWSTGYKHEIVPWEKLNIALPKGLTQAQLTRLTGDMEAAIARNPQFERCRYGGYMLRQTPRPLG